MPVLKSSTAMLFLSAAILIAPLPSYACGGFFCTTVPINQAAEQIVFRQEAGQVTAMVRIQYAGNAEDFAWVVPVPDTPEISLGADITFNELDFATRPQFRLESEGQVCEQDQPQPFPVASPSAESGDSGGGITIEEELTVGPFDIDIVSSDNADDMSIWLQDNGYLLDDRGVSFIEPYVLAGMKFVALKLRSGESSGSIQPLIMKYPSEKPMVPIRLTAIAAEDDMGVLVWVVNNARAIPENYEHVTPNYTKLDWYSGSFNAYGSYQALVSDAMNETASGQGFATDYAGAITEQIQGRLTEADIVEGNLAQLDAIGDDAEYLVNSLVLTTDPGGALASLQFILPLPQGEDTNLYFDRDQLASTFTPDELSQARIETRQAIVTRELEPIGNGVELLPQGAYLTRLYTTLSASEMTVDPTFNYNSNMPEQPIIREAKLTARCENNISSWDLTLGSGTDREGEKVLEVSGQPVPVGVLPQAVDDQPSAFLRQRTSADAAPELVFQADSSVLEIAADGTTSGGVVNMVDNDNDGFLGAAGYVWLLIGSLMLSLRYGRTLS